MPTFLEQSRGDSILPSEEFNHLHRPAERDGLTVSEVRQESCSAKESGYRPVFNQLLIDLKAGMFDGLLTWAPDRLSRNAGDLGTLVDLMDQNKLQQIRTFSQTFSNTPNEKFLLMILCSQAKLENDNKGINVKRGIRAKCEMGWRPGMSPLGYYNRSFNGTKDIVIDPDRGELVKEMFERVAYRGYSGRQLVRWFDQVGLVNRSGKKVTLSQVYKILRSPFYYGEFDYGPNRYKGSHQPLITRELWDLVQEKLVAPHKSKWGAKQFAFKYLMHCGACGSEVTGEEKFKRLKNGTINRHVYYHCTRSVDYNCKEPYVNEETLVDELINFVDHYDLNSIEIGVKLRNALDDYQRMTKEILRQKGVEQSDSDLKSYAHYVLREGTNKERADFIRGLNLPLKLKQRKVVLEESQALK